MKHFSPENFRNCHLGLLLGRAALLKDRIIDTHMEPHGITAAQFKVLIIMAQYGVDTPAELCRHLSLGQKAALGPLLFDGIRQQRITASRFDGPWHNVGTPEQLAELNTP